jgi:hypothetical protein
MRIINEKEYRQQNLRYKIIHYHVLNYSTRLSNSSKIDENILTARWRRHLYDPQLYHYVSWVKDVAHAAA